MHSRMIYKVGKVIIDTSTDTSTKPLQMYRYGRGERTRKSCVRLGTGASKHTQERTLDAFPSPNP